MGIHSVMYINTLRPEQHGRHFADDIFKCIFLNEKVWIPIKISLKFNLITIYHKSRLYKCNIFSCDKFICVCVSLTFMSFVPKGPINNIPALFQIMAWHRPGDKPLFEPMMARLPTHICVTRPQWVNGTKTTVYALNQPCTSHLSTVYFCKVVCFGTECMKASLYKTPIKLTCAEKLNPMYLIFVKTIFSLWSILFSSSLIVSII